jgi:hypothetical protein
MFQFQQISAALVGFLCYKAAVLGVAIIPPPVDGPGNSGGAAWQSGGPGSSGSSIDGSGDGWRPRRADSTRADE